MPDYNPFIRNRISHFRLFLHVILVQRVSPPHFPALLLPRTNHATGPISFLCVCFGRHARKYFAFVKAFF
jgi:hypothetical protein